MGSISGLTVTRCLNSWLILIKYKSSAHMVSFEWSHLRISSIDSETTIDLHTKQIAPCERTTEEFSFKW